MTNGKARQTPETTKVLTIPRKSRIIVDMDKVQIESNLPALPDNLPQPPDIISAKAATGRPQAYNKNLAIAIIYDVATSDENMDNIAKRHGITKPTFYSWIWSNEQFFNCYARALENRALIFGDKMAENMDELANYVNNESNDPRIMHAKIQLFHRKSGMYQWLMSRYNRKLFGDKMDIDSNITISSIDSRDAAWQLIEQAKATTYTDVSAQAGAHSQ